MNPQMLLHGDLHHWNILSDADRGWMAIDPKGVIGASCPGRRPIYQQRDGIRRDRGREAADPA